MQRKLQFKGDYLKAHKELSQDKNNAVAFLYPSTQVNKIENKPFSNATITVKDNYATKDAPTTGSSLILENFKPNYNATIVEKLLSNGANIVAKVHLDELALGGTGTHSAFGLIKNKIDESRLSGGSSSGSVSTFTKNIAIAIGSDTGDSVRLPASYNGTIGFKPSYGAISRYGLFAYASSLDTVAYFGHSVNDIIVASQVMFGRDEKDMTSVDVEINNVIKTKPKSVLMLDFSSFNKDFVNKSINKLKEKLVAEGVNVEVIKPNLDILECIKPIYKVISFSEASSNLANLNGIAFGSRIEGQT